MAVETIRVDNKGRLTLPVQMRKALGIEPGDTMFVECEQNGRVVRYTKAENPFDALARHAEQEYRDGRTRGLRDFAREHDIDLDAG